MPTLTTRKVFLHAISRNLQQNSLNCTGWFWFAASKQNPPSLAIWKKASFHNSTGHAEHYSHKHNVIPLFKLCNFLWFTQINFSQSEQIWCTREEDQRNWKYFVKGKGSGDCGKKNASPKRNHVTTYQQFSQCESFPCQVKHILLQSKKSTQIAMHLYRYLTCIDLSGFVSAHNHLITHWVIFRRLCFVFQIFSLPFFSFSGRFLKIYSCLNRSTFGCNNDKSSCTYLNRPILRKCENISPPVTNSRTM